MKMYLPSSFIVYITCTCTCTCMLGLRWMCMHLCMNLIKRTTDIQEKWKILKIYIQSQWRVVLLLYHIFWQSSVQRGRHTQLCIITSLKWIIQICSNFYCWVCEIAFCSPNPHCCLGKLIKLELTFCHRFHEVRALRALMHAARGLRENGDDFIVNTNTGVFRITNCNHLTCYFVIFYINAH